MIQRLPFMRGVVGRFLEFGKDSFIEVKKSSGKFARSNKAALFSMANAGTTDVLTAATTLSVEDSGKTIHLALAAGFTLTLPLLADSIGFKCKIRVATGPTGANYIVVGNAANPDTLIGAVLDGEAATVAEQVIFADQMNFVASSAAIGDYIEVENPVGSQWYVSGYSRLAASITATG